MKRIFAFMTVVILALAGIVQSAGAVTTDAVIRLFLSRNPPGNWRKTDTDRVEGYVNYHDYVLYVNTINGKVSEIVFRGWFDDLQKIPRGERMGYKWSDGIEAYFAFTVTLEDLGIFEDNNFPDGANPINPDDTYPILLRGSIVTLDIMKESWRNIHISKGLLEATNKATDAYFLLRGREHGEFEVYVKLP